MRVHRNYRSTVSALVKEGWILSRRGSGHNRLMPPPGNEAIRPIHFPVSPSDQRGLRNFIAEVRRAKREIDKGE